MAKEKQTRRMIAMALAAAVTVTAVPVDALAASDYSNKVARMQAKNEARKEAAAQKMGRVTVTLEEEVAAEEVVEEAVEEIAAADEQQEAPEVTVKTEGTADAETGVVGDNGSMETTTVTPVTDANGKVVGDITVVEGESVTTTEKEGPMNEVTVPVIGEGVEPDHYDEDGNPVYKNTDEDSLPDPEVSGDVQEGEDDKEYDYLTKEETPREVEVTITGSEISYDQDKDAYEGEQDLEFMTPIWDGTQKNLGGGTLDWFPGNPLEQTVDGYDYTPYGFMHNDVTHMYYIRTDKDGGMVDNSGKAVYYYDAETDTYSRTIPKDVVLYDIAYQNIKPLYYQAEDGSFELIDGNDEKGVAKIESVVFQSNSMMVAFYDKSQTHSQEMWDAVYDDLMAMGTNPSTAVAKEFYAKHPEFLDIIDISRLVDDYQDGEVTEETKKLYNTIFALWEKEKALLQFEAPNNIIPAYCVDVNTGTIRGAWYELMNVEDAGYYSTERTEENGYISDSDRIKAIALHGYWGTAEGETGSLTAMKEFLQGRLDEATEKGETLCFTQADIDGLTHGCALSVTQHSLWRFGNSLDGAIMDAYTYTYSNREERNARIERLIEYFTTMPVDTKEFDEHEIITQDKFIGEMSLTVGDKADDHVNNQDDDKTNDAYKTELSFSLVVTPGEGDDLVVSIVSGDEVLAKARIAGNGEADDDSFAGADDFENDGNGNYTFKNLTLVENSGQTFSLNLEGAQYLEQGVYLFKAAGGADYSQTYTTIASGEKSVDLEMEIDLTFNVEEGSVKETRKWKKTTSRLDTSDDEGSEGGQEDPVTPPTTPDDYEDIEEVDPPLSDAPGQNEPAQGDPEEPVVDIGEEDVPMADAPEEPVVAGEEEIVAETGDSNHMTAGFAGMLAALAGLFGLRRKEN